MKLNSKHYFNLFSLMVASISIYSQDVRFLVIDSMGIGIPYVNAYAGLSDYGAISNNQGDIQFELDKITKNDSIVFSCIGYNEFTISKNDLVTADEKIIILREKDHLLNNIEIKSKSVRFKSIKAGVTGGICRSEFYTFPKYTGGEYGIIIENNKTCYIEEIHFNLSNVSHDSLKYEINLYHYENEIKESINSSRHFIELNRNSKKGKVDLKDEEIRISANFAILFESIQERDYTYSIKFKSQCSGKNKFITKKDSGKWKVEGGIVPAIWCKLRCVNE